jgi:hypothetical protein
MAASLNISGIFASEEELAETIRRRRICYDIEPYYTAKSGQLVQIGYQINLYGTFPESDKKASPDDREFEKVLRDVRRVAEALSNTCDPLHMCDSTIEDSNTVSYSQDRKMRPDVTVHIPVFDQQKFGHPVDRHTEDIVHMAGEILETAGVRKKHWDG